jgi:hypothetical protein
MTFRPYLCWAVERAHAFLGNADPERVPHQFSECVCAEHLPLINRCRRDKGLEELIEFPDSYPRGGDVR